MKYFLMSVLSLCLFGCSAGLPDQMRDLDEFVLEAVVEERIDISTETTSSWRQENFPSQCEWHRFKRVVDGDTIIVNDNDRVRLIGIDTPESKKEGTPVEAFSLEASRHLKSLTTEGADICLITDRIGDESDIYGRWLRYAFTEDGKDLNALMLESGLATGYFRFAFDRKTEFMRLETTAEENKVGVWSD